MKVLIIGGVAGGASAAARLRRLDETAEIVMFERTGFVSYANCGLPYYVGGVIEEERKLTLQTPESFRNRFDIDVRVNSEALSIDRDSKKVRVRNLKDGSEYDEPYDILILSPGAKAMRPDIPGIDDLRVMTLRTVEDTLAMRRFVTERRPQHVVVAGGGFIGLEIAENLVDMGVKVTLVQRPDHVLPPFDRDMAADIHHHMRSKGVDLRLSEAVEGFDTGERFSVLLRSGCKVEADMAVVALGVVPESDLAKAAGLETGMKGAIVTDAHMRTSDPNIYAVGDAVMVKEFVSGTDAVISLAGPANRQGRIAADNICGIPSEYKGSQGSSVIKVFDMTVASTGLNEKTAAAAGLDYGKVYTYSASHATYYPGAMNMSVKVLFENGSGRILGAQIVGYEGVDKRIDVIATAIRAKQDYRFLEELDLAYAPPYSSAKDPVNMAGFVIGNVVEGRVKQFFWNELDGLSKDPSVFLVDVRTAQEYAYRHFEGALNIPVDEIRDWMSEIPKDRHICLICHSALRSYIAARILMQNGYECSHLAGGFRLYSSVVDDIAIGSPDGPPCGQPSR